MDKQFYLLFRHVYCCCWAAKLGLADPVLVPLVEKPFWKSFLNFICETVSNQDIHNGRKVSEKDLFYILHFFTFNSLRFISVTWEFSPAHCPHQLVDCNWSKLPFKSSELKADMPQLFIPQPPKRRLWMLWKRISKPFQPPWRKTADLLTSSQILQFKSLWRLRVLFPLVTSWRWTSWARTCSWHWPKMADSALSKLSPLPSTQLWPLTEERLSVKSPLPR